MPKSRVLLMVVSVLSAFPSLCVTFRLDLKQRQTPSSRGAVEIACPRAERLPNQKIRTPCRDKPRTGTGSRLTVLFFFEKPLQVETADGRGGGIKAPAYLDFLSHLRS